MPRAPPPSLSDAEAATLPIAALTAWSTLLEGGVRPGASVLVQGTGGVALFALQFAKAAGAMVIATSSSDEKLQRLKTLGADVVINYRSDAQWPQAAKAATGGRGVDIIVETGGATLPQSLAAAFGGFVGVVGFVAGYEATFGVRQLLGPMLRVQGIAIGSRALRSDESRDRAARHQTGNRLVVRVGRRGRCVPAHGLGPPLRQDGDHALNAVRSPLDASSDWCQKTLT
jgi:NADPH:quinone reductase-like Zn-dependent oxidoreductase